MQNESGQCWANNLSKCEECFHAERVNAFYSGTKIIITDSEHDVQGVATRNSILVFLGWIATSPPFSIQKIPGRNQFFRFYYKSTIGIIPIFGRVSAIQRRHRAVMKPPTTKLWETLDFRISGEWHTPFGTSERNPGKGRWFYRQSRIPCHFHMWYRT